MLKVTKSVFISFLIFILCLGPKKSEATMAMALPISAPATITLLVFGSGLTSAFYLATVIDCDDPKGCVNRARYAVALGIVGIILLDQKQSIKPQFSSLEENDAKKLIINSDQLSAYNSELEEINAIAQTIAKQTINKFKDHDVSIETTQMKVDHYSKKLFFLAMEKGLISHQSLGVIEKIRQQQRSFK